MFGILSPCRQLLCKTDRAGYTSAYCSLCGLLGRQYGLKARMLVVNDIATLWWLLSPRSTGGEDRLRTSNCIRGVGRLRNQDLSDLQALARPIEYSLGRNQGSTMIWSTMAVGEVAWHTASIAAHFRKLAEI